MLAMPSPSLAPTAAAACLVHDARAGVVRHVRVGDDAEGARPVLFDKVGEERLVATAHQRTASEAAFHGEEALDGLQGRGRGGLRAGSRSSGGGGSSGSCSRSRSCLVLGVELRDAALGEDVRGAALGVAHLHVVHVGVDAEREVGWEGPWGGGPRDEGGRALLRPAAALGEEGEGHDDRGVDRPVVVVLRGAGGGTVGGPSVETPPAPPPCLVGLEVRQRRRARGRVGHDLERAVDEALAPQLREDPPHGLHEVRVHRLVVVLEVDPAAHALRGGIGSRRVEIR